MMTSDVIRVLQQRGAHFRVIHHAPTADCIDEAIALGVAADEVLKAVVLETAGHPVLAILPASRRLDMHLVRAALGDSRARLATEAEIERDLPGCELGAVPPLGSVLHAPMYVDPEVLEHRTVAFAAGTQADSVEGDTEEMFTGEMVTVTPISERQQAGAGDDH
jgi:Ala-tRNA(Pro) deacylase